MSSSESTSQRRKAARKANGSGTIKKRKDGRYEGQVFVRTTSGEFKRVSVYGPSWEDCDEKINPAKSRQLRGHRRGCKQLHRLAMAQLLA